MGVDDRPLSQKIYFLHSMGPAVLVMFLFDLAAMLGDDQHIRELLNKYNDGGL